MKPLSLLVGPQMAECRTGLSAAFSSLLKGFDDSAVNPGWQQIVNYAQSNNIELLVYLHPEKEENQKKDNTTIARTHNKLRTI